MKVLRLCSVYEVPQEALDERAVRFDPIGGMQSHTGSLTRALDRIGVQQQVVTTRPPLAAPTEKLSNGTVHRVGIGVPHLRQAFGICAAALLPRVARDPDIVHAHLGEDLAVLPVAAAAARLCRSALVVTIHTSLRHTLAVTDARSWVLRTLGGPIEVATCRRADAVLTLTPRLARRVAALGCAAERVHVIPSGVELAQFGASDDPLAGCPRPRIVFVGRLCTQKDPLTLVRAAALVGAERAHFVIVGDGPARAEVEDAVRQAGLQRRVRLIGAVPRIRVPSYLAAADAFVLPSRYEELGTALIEAMAAGLPVVATDTGGIPDLVTHGENGLLVPPDSPLELARALERVVADASLRRRLGEAGRRVARAYDWETLAAKVHDVYVDVVARRAAGAAPQPA